MKKIYNVPICLLFMSVILVFGCNSEKKALEKIVNTYELQYSQFFRYCKDNPNISDVAIAVGSTSLNIGLVSEHEADSINNAYNITNVDEFTVFFKDNTEKIMYVVNENDSIYVSFKEEMPYIAFISEIATNRGQDELQRYLMTNDFIDLNSDDSVKSLHWRAIDKYKFSPLTYRLIVVPDTKDKL